MKRGLAPQERKIEPAIHAKANVAVNQEQVQLRMRSLVGPLCGQVEAAAAADRRAACRPPASGE